MQNSVASKVAKARDAADRAVARCDAARDDAIREAGLLGDAGDDVARRDEAALAALHASVRCADASLEALEVAARCEAVAEEVPALHRGDATFAAEQARAAAARCDAEGGAVAASGAANAFADSCAAACGDAAIPTLTAQEAAARCVRARDDAGTATLVAQNTATWRDVLTLRNPYQESADDHKEARKDAVAAALAARQAALCCAAASRRAVSAASIARKTASRCEAAGGDGVAAAAEARKAADRCVAARVDEAAAAGADVAEAAAGEAVPPADETAGATDAAAHAAPMGPLADAAASEARKAAASCDTALVDPAANVDTEYLDKMRGWLMTVATLFVGIAFQAIMQPPDGMSWEQCGKFTETGKADSSAPWPASAPSIAAATAGNVTPSFAWSPCLYLICNTLTMAIGLTMLVVMMTMSKARTRFTLFYIKGMLTGLAFSVAGAFITGMPGGRGVQLYTVSFFSLYVILFSIGLIIKFIL